MSRWSVKLSARFPPPCWRNSPPYHLNRRLSKHQSWSGHFKKEKNLLLPLRFEPLTVQLAASSFHQLCYFFHAATGPGRPGPPNYRGFTITPKHSTRYDPLDVRSTRPRDLYLTTHNKHPMRPTELEPAIPASKRSHDIDGAATGIDTIHAILLCNPNSRNNDYK